MTALTRRTFKPAAETPPEAVAEPAGEVLETGAAMRTSFSTSQLSVIPSSTASPGPAGQSDATATAVEPLPQVSPIRAAPNPELAALLRKQHDLAMRDGVDEEYAEIGRRIAAIS